jgi:hypothetical protein
MKKAVHEYHEGSEANKRFKSAIKTILSVPRAVMQRREKEYQEQQALKPKRGPKPKASASRARGSDD